MSRSSPSSGSPLKAEDHPSFPWAKNPFSQSAWRIGWELKNKLRGVPLGIKKGYLADFLDGYNAPKVKANIYSAYQTGLKSDIWGSVKCGFLAAILVVAWAAALGGCVWAGLLGAIAVNRAHE